MIVYLHAGTHKTGTTAIQAFLHRQRALLAQRGLYLPEAGLVGPPPECGHHNIAFELGGFDIDPSAGGLDDLIAELRERAPERVCVTSENFYPLAGRPERLRLLRDAFDSIGAEVRPILYFRPQAMLLEALYAELVKHGMADSFRAVFEEVLDCGSVAYNDTVYDLAYDRGADAFAQAFGREAMTVFPYLASAKPESIVAQFLSIVLPGSEDLDLTALGAWERVNVSIGFRAVASILASNRRASSDGGFEGVFDELLEDRGETVDDVLRPNGRYWRGKFEPLGVDDIARLLARFTDGNRALRATYGVDVPVCTTDRLFEEVRSRPPS
jgi:hypothetical protein